MNNKLLLFVSYVIFSLVVLSYTSFIIIFVNNIFNISTLQGSIVIIILSIFFIFSWASVVYFYDKLKSITINREIGLNAGSNV